MYNKCNHKKSVYIFSDMKIKRYKEACGMCGKFIKWVPNQEWEQIKHNAVIISESEKR